MAIAARAMEMATRMAGEQQQLVDGNKGGGQATEMRATATAMEWQQCGQWRWQ